VASPTVFAAVILICAVSTFARPALAQTAPAPVLTAPAIPSSGSAELDQYRASRIAIYTDDFGQLERYRSEDAALAPPAVNENRVVFLGDSITDYWKLADYFPGKPYMNRGVDGQSTPEMLVRFRQDVIGIHPKIVIILAGTNDVAGVTGRTTNEDIEANYASMAELARVHGIRVVFASLLPVYNYTAESKESFALRPRERLLALNAWLKDYCEKDGLVYLNYYDALLDDQGMLKRELSDDGLHPNAAGYRIMAPLAEKAIASAMADKH
jgi:acyl-CoA thioesterase I